MKDIISLFKYVFENILNWSPIDVRDYCNYALIKRIHLERPYRQLTFPSEIDPYKDTFYLAHILYPNQIKISKSVVVLHTYEKMISGELTKWPKQFFLHHDGGETAEICLRYAISHLAKPHSTKELYEMFSHPLKAKRWLNSVHLKTPCEDIYETPLDFLHAALTAEENNDFWYYYYRSKNEIAAAKERRKRPCVAK